MVAQPALSRAARHTGTLTQYRCAAALGEPRDKAFLPVPFPMIGALTDTGMPLLQQLGVDYAQGFALGRPVESIEQVAIASALVN